MVSARFGSVRFGSVPLLVSTLFSVGACGPTGGDGGSSASVGAPLDTECGKGVLLSDRHRFEYIGASVTQRLCVPDGLESPIIVSTDDATGKVVDFESLASADAAAFHGWHASMQPQFRAELEAKPGQAHDVYVWFYTDEGDAPDKEAQAADVTVAAAAAATQETKIRSSAGKLAAKLGAVSGVQVVSPVTAPIEYGIPIVRARAKLAELDAIGGWPDVWRIDPVPSGQKLHSDNYYYTTLESVPDFYGFDGTGVTVATYEGDFPDSWANLPGAPPGSCNSGGQLRKCHCANGGQGNASHHSRLTMGIVRRNTGILGMANGATTIMANFNGGCLTNGLDNYSSALNWATSNGATVISHSASTFGDNPPVGQTPHDIFFDYKATTYPFPFIVGSSGNDVTAVVGNRLRNGVVVGGGIEQGGTNRSQVQISGTSYFNEPGGSTPAGYEVPHLVAISDNVDSAGFWLNTTQLTGGSSMAAPEVAGIAASLQEMNPTLKTWPEVMTPGLMASADEDVDNTVLNLHDGMDDRDGAGLVNAWQAWQVLVASSKRNGGDAPVRAGHDYGTISSGVAPAQTFYWENYQVRVPAGEDVRIVSFMQTRPTCPQNPRSIDCTASPYPLIGLFVYDGTTLVGAAYNTTNNYQYVSFVNTSGVQKDYTAKIFLISWSGLSSTTFGMAWSSY